MVRPEAMRHSAAKDEGRAKKTWEKEVVASLEERDPGNVHLQSLRMKRGKPKGKS